MVKQFIDMEKLNYPKATLTQCIIELCFQIAMISMIVFQIICNKFGYNSITTIRTVICTAFKDTTTLNTSFLRFNTTFNNFR